MLARVAYLLMILSFFVNKGGIHAAVLGDVNDDDKVDLSEAIHALQIVAGHRSSTSLAIQQAIDALPDSGGTVHVKAGVYSISRAIHINRSNVTLKGEQGVKLQLTDHVNQPVILIGTDVETPTSAHEIYNIRICDIEINGNRENQDSETNPALPWIRNNGIDVRKSDNVWIENVNIHDTRSGGVVTSWNSDRIFISNSIFHHNFYDGIALYAGQDIQVSNILCHDNGNAGISIDNNLKNASFIGGIIRNNGDVGIFVRDAEDLNFKNLMIKENGSHGCFLSHQATGNNTGIKRLFFGGCSFLSNKGYGLWLASTVADSQDNTVGSSIFIGNTTGCTKVDPGGELTELSNSCK